MATDLITIDCPNCDGHGTVERHQLTSLGDFSLSFDCPHCCGDGTVHDTVEDIDWSSFDDDGTATPHETICLVLEDSPSWQPVVTAYDNRTDEVIARITDRCEDRLLRLTNALVHEWVRQQLEAAR